MKLVTPATIGDVAECCGPMPHLTWMAMRAQLQAGPSYALRDDADRAVAVAGLCPLAETGAAEAWFKAAPEAQRHLLRIMRAIALTAPRLGYRAIRAVVTTPAGRRIAEASGFALYDRADETEVWIWLASSVSSEGPTTARSSRRSRRKPPSAGKSPSLPASSPKPTPRPPAPAEGSAAEPS